ncbi:MAG TPA: 23S rRNA (uracil(1939)-C(5))-methyltransferase RlmD [bacterium]|nr:23S rRNA (uracil(1939)-C(5))-methyltransferase RlmD [bacterium]
MATYPLNKEQEFEAEIEDVLAFGGDGITRVDNWVVFVRDVLPGAKVKAKLIKRKRNFGEAIPVETLEASPWKTDWPCPHYPECGGCKFQDLAYEVQLENKREQVADLLERIGKFQEIEVKPTLGSEKIFHYRNKMEFSFGTDRWILEEDDPGTPEDFAFGLHAPGRWDKILDLDICYLQSEVRNHIFADVKQYVLEHDYDLWDLREKTGYLRYLVMREGEHTGQVMLNFVTGKDDPDRLAPLVDILVEKYPQIHSVVNNVNTRVGESAVGELEYLMYGEDIILDRIGDLEFEISAGSFFQTNTLQAEGLYEHIKQIADVQPEDVVYDLYCGTGTIALYLASGAQRVYGFEVNQETVENAVRNAYHNQIFNAQFERVDMNKHQEFHRKIKQIEKPDVIVIDPPRSGVHPKTLKELRQLHPEKYVYVSCNPSTLARDLKDLSDGTGYELATVQPVDMFPHTPHVEVVTKLERISS